MRHVDPGSWPGLRLTPLRGAQLQARRPHRYRTRRPRWRWPAIQISPDPCRCAHLAVQRFDLTSPDYSIEHDGQPDIPMALCVCTHAGRCRYQAVLWPAPWHPFGPVRSCAGFDLVYLDRPRVIVDTAPSGYPWWPEAPPSEPREAEPDAEALITYAGLLLISSTLRTLNTSRPREARAAARRRCTTWRQRRAGPFAPTIAIRDGTMRIWPPHTNMQRTPPAVELTVDAFLDLALPPPARQLAFAL